jgi:hypothetical protein
MKTRLIKFAKGATAREEYSNIMVVRQDENQQDEKTVTISLVNHPDRLRLKIGESAECSGLIEFHNACICLVAWSERSMRG